MREIICAGRRRNIRIRRVYTIFIVSLLIYIASAVVTQAQTPASGASTAISSPENSTIKVLGIDSTAFPKIKANLFINKFCALAGNLKHENFKVKEDGNDRAIDNLYFSGNASGQKLDFAVVFDDTGSMGKEINAMKSKVKDLTDTLKASEINATYSLVSFKDIASVKTEWTDDPDLFKRKVNSLQPIGGNDEPEVPLDAMAKVLAMGFRSDAQKIILVITDAHAHYKNDSSAFSMYTKEDIEKDLKKSGAIFILISPMFEESSNYLDLREVANDIQSTWIDINSADFSVILEQISGILTGTYVIEYTSPDQAPAENRTVLVAVDKQGCVTGSNAGSYISPGSVNRLQVPPSTPRRVLELSISGLVFDDSNGDGVKGTDEVGLEGWKVLLLDGPDGYSTTTITDQKGYYIFTGLLPGNYGLTAAAQGKWTATAPKEEVQKIELIDAHNSEIDFGFKVSGPES